MSLQDFKYYFLEEDGRSIFRQGNVVNSSGRHQPQALSPDGWQEIVVGWQRDLAKYYGLTRNFSLPLKFLRDSAFILRNEFARRNIERKIFLLIQQLQLEYTDEYYKFTYKYLYKGQLDLSSFRSALDQVTANIMEGGLVKQFKAAENTQQTYQFDEEAIDVFLDGIILSETQNFIITEATQVVAIGTSEHLIGISTTTAEGAAAGMVPFSIFFQNSVPADYSSDVNYFLAYTQAIVTRFKGSYTFNGDLGGHYEVKLKTSTGIVIDLFTGTIPAGDVQISFDVSFTTAPGEKYFLTGFYDMTGVSTALQYKQGEASISYKSRGTGTTINGYEPMTLFRKLVGSATGNPDNAKSDLLIQHRNVVATSGDAIRGLANATLKTSLAEFYADYTLTCFAGLSIQNGKIVMEDRASFFDASNPIDLGLVKNHEWYEATEMLGNVLKVGSIKPDIDDVNGKFDPNGSSNYTLPIQSVVRDIDMVGPYKKGPYEIESKRLNLEGKDTTDNDADGQVFVLDVVPGAIITTTVSFSAELGMMTASNSIDFQVGQRIAISGSGLNTGKYTVTGVGSIFVSKLVFLDRAVVDEIGVEVTIKFPHTLDRSPVIDADPEVCPSPESFFNARFTPKGIMLIAKRWLHSLLHGFDGEKITLSSGDKNTKFKCTIDGVVIDEDRAENISDFGPKIFLPVFHDMECPVTPELIDLLEQNPNRCFQFTDEDGVTLKGFNVKSALAPNTLAAQKFTLLSCPDNDLTQLIN